MQEFEKSIQLNEKSVHRVREVVSRRKENCKVYRMSDGTEQAIYYPQPIHLYHEETKQYEEFDRSLVESEDGRYYVNAKNRFTARFNREESNDELFSIEDGDHGVTVCSLSDKKRKRNGVSPKLRRHEKTGEKRRDTLSFENVRSGADYEYELMDNGVKENIVVKEKADAYRFSFVLHCKNVSACCDKTAKHIAFKSNESGEDVFFIPAPFMKDANGVVSENVWYEVENTDCGEIILTTVADSEWLNADDRVFPVAIDPQIQHVGASKLQTFCLKNGAIYEASMHPIGTTLIDDFGNREYLLSLFFSDIPYTSYIKKAELIVYQASACSDNGYNNKLCLHRSNDVKYTGSGVPTCSEYPIDYAMMQSGSCEDGETVSYTFDVTSLIDEQTRESNMFEAFILKLMDETTTDNITLYGGTADSAYQPRLVVSYESTFGVNNASRTHTHDLGSFGQGMIDLRCGNLMFEFEDFAWAGNRMPVSIKHLYNSAIRYCQYTANYTSEPRTADFSAMHIGYGNKLNVMQSMVYQEDMSQYVYIDDSGTETWFEPVLSDGVTTYREVGGDMTYDPATRILKQGEDSYLFDAAGRLVRITDGHANSMAITYTDGRLTSVTDGVGREFEFTYDENGWLTTLMAPDGSCVNYGYADNRLTNITGPDGRSLSVSYTYQKPTSVIVKDADGNPLYKTEYTFNGYHLTSVTEYGVENGAFVLGVKSNYIYSAKAGRTVVETVEPKDEAEGETEDRVIKTVYTFDREGNIVSEYAYTQDTGNASVNGNASGIHPYAGEGGAGSYTAGGNLLLCHNFADLSGWTATTLDDEFLTVTSCEKEDVARYGKNVLRMNSWRENSTYGVYQTTPVLSAGEYTFSVYLNLIMSFHGCDNCGAYVRVTTADGGVLAESERYDQWTGEYSRAVAPFTLTEAQSVRVYVLCDGVGSVYADAAQLEKSDYVGTYNMLENGHFEYGMTRWSPSDTTVGDTDEECFNMTRSLKMAGNLDAVRHAYQDVQVRTNRTTRETFTLSGWAKGCSLPNHEREGLPASTFRLRAEIRYNDTEYDEHGSETYTADFCPETESWQFASVTFAKSQYRTVESVRVYCDYDYNVGEVFFDDIRLVRDSAEYDLTTEDFAEEDFGDSVESDNSVSGPVEEAPVFEELTDAYGNVLTETTFNDSEFGTMYRSFGFDEHGNDLVRETDTRGNETRYAMCALDSRPAWVTDRLGNVTVYEYDTAGRTTMVASKEGNRATLATVEYAYDAFDNMTEIIRGDGMKYVLAYNAYHNLESIGVDGKDEKLVQYTYKNGNGRLKAVTYANGDTMKATYNTAGQMVAEKWYNASNTLTAHYKYAYDGQGNIVRSIDITAGKEYTYTYEGGMLMRAAEYAITVGDNEIVTAKTLINTVRYSYDRDGQLTKKTVAETGQTTFYEHGEDGCAVMKFTAGGNAVTVRSKTDAFGRKTFDELQLSSGTVSRQFRYHAGKATEEHADNKKLRSTPTTQLVSEIVLSDGRTIAYEYDAEERITKVTDSLEGVTEYTYDALGQLLTEKKNGAVVNEMVYDNYGNILAKNGVTYTYGDANWRDLLTAYDGQPIAYDAQGNPTSYRGHALTWEKGRQLKSFGDITYTYNANGIRTSKTVNGQTHHYTLDGTKILRETWDGNTLVPLYDNEDSVIGIVYNDEPYYFQKNLQGDVISITDKDGEVVANYTYDAWGKLTAITGTAFRIALLNPFRYRGYYYDDETELYYLQSRYYDPEVGRFINADEAEVLFLFAKNCLTVNSFSYVGNNPLYTVDFTGYIATNIISGIVGAILNVLIDFLTSALSYWAKHNFTFKGFKYNLWSWSTACAAASGFAAGLIISSTYSRWTCAIGGGVINGFTNVINCIIKKRKFSIKDLLIDVVFGLIWGYFGGKGVGRAYFQKNLFSKGGYFVYKGQRFYASKSLELIKPVIKDFARSFAIYIGTQFADWLQKFARGKA